MRFKGLNTITYICTIFFAIFHIVRVVLADHDGSDDPLDWLRDSIPGEPGVDYPIFSEIETTSFSCKDRVFGGKLFTYIKALNVNLTEDGLLYFEEIFILNTSFLHQLKVIET